MGWPEARVVTILGAPEPHSGQSVQSPDRVDQTLHDLGIDRPFILYVGGADRRKNLDGTLAAFAALPAAVRDAHLLVIVCALGRDEKMSLQREAQALGVRRELRLTDFVDEGALQTLYQRCRLSLFPSYYEGMGLPVLEALLCGAPVVASDRSAIPEFAGPVSRLADPSSPAAMASAIGAVLSEPRDERIDERRAFAAGFEWPRTARLATDAMEAALRRRHEMPREHRGERLRIAWVSPLPPTPSGIADYSAEMLSRLTREFEIEVVISPEATLASGVARRLRVIRPDEVRSRHEELPFDLFVHHIGNSELHIYMLEVMRRYPGLTVLHDLDLGGLALQADAAGAWPGSLTADVEAEGAVALAATLRRGEGNHQHIVEEVRFSRRFVESSDAVAVHSAWSWNRIGSEVSSTPCFVIPMGVPLPAPEPVSALRLRLGVSPEDFVVATLGEVTAAKRIDRLVRAVGMLPPRDPRAAADARNRRGVSLQPAGAARRRGRAERIRTDSIRRPRPARAIWLPSGGQRTLASSSDIRLGGKPLPRSFARSRLAAPASCPTPAASRKCPKTRRFVCARRTTRWRTSPARSFACTTNQISGRRCARERCASSPGRTISTRPPADTRPQSGSPLPGGDARTVIGGTPRVHRLEGAARHAAIDDAAPEPLG